MAYINFDDRDLIIDLIKVGIWKIPEEISVGICHLYLKQLARDFDLSSYIPKLMSKFSLEKCTPGWQTLSHLMNSSGQRALSILEFFFIVFRDDALKCCKKITPRVGIGFIFCRSRYDAKSDSNNGRFG
jgi:hypothetical protein